MIKLDPFEQPIETKVLLNMLNDFSNIPDVREHMKSYVSVFVDLWTRHLISGHVRNPFPLVNTMNDETFPLEHILGNYFTISNFSINSIRILLECNILHAVQLQLSEIQDSIHHTDMGSQHLDDDFLKTPVIVVLMPSGDNGKISMYEVIDGNHRVSSALYLKRDIPVLYIQDFALPPFAFLSDDDWKIFHIVQGFTLLAGGMLDANFYITGLRNLLNLFYPI